MEKGKNCAIIGCGYVGKALAKFWTSLGFVATCTTRKNKNLSNLKAITQKTMLLQGSDEAEIKLVLEQNDVIVVTVAADTIQDYKDAYLRTAQSIRHKAAEIRTPKILIYTSSASVYGDHQGKWVDEKSPLLAESEQAKILEETEKVYLSLAQLGWRVVILRLGEIYGPNRDLATKVQHFQGKVLPGKGSHFTNMIHLEDIIQGIHYSYQHNLQGIYNLADDDHPTRKEFYDKICDHLGLSRVLWDANLARLSRGNKRISNHKIKAAGYEFIHPHRVLHIEPTKA